MAQRSTVVAAVITLALISMPSPGVSTARYTCVNPETGLPVITAGKMGDAPAEIASRYCKGDVAAAQRALENSMRATDDTILHGAILRLPNKP